MEDRHTISDPRPVLPDNGSSKNSNGNQDANENDDVVPSWEVDIMRDDTVIVDTVVLNSKILPPRTNKKGKVVWRLPDSIDKMPSFGTDDRRRILDIFKERKKKRKQEKKKAATQNGCACDALGESGHGSLERRDSAGNRTNGQGERGRDETERAKLVVKENHKTSEDLSKEQQHSTTTAKKNVKGVNGKGTLQKQKFLDTRDSRRGSPNILRRSRNSRSPDRHPPGLRISPDPASSSPEPSQSSLPAQSQQHSLDPTTSDLSKLSFNEQPQNSTSDTPTPKLPYEQQHSNITNPSSSSPAFFTPPPSPDALFILVPRNERPDPLPGEIHSSLAVPAASHFVSTYYSHFGATSPDRPIHDLARYYTAKAQKSVSVGGAHSVVTGRRDILAQILNLSRSAFVVRGVVAQDSVDGKGVHILVTGITRTGEVVANFAHSVSLTPVHSNLPSGININESCPPLALALEKGFPFQIHNDALALLSGESPMAPVLAPQPVPMQQPKPQPPPGLF